VKRKMGWILKEIDSLFTQVQETQDGIIVLDDLDVLSPNLLVDNQGGFAARTLSVNPIAIDQSKLIADRLSHLLEAANLKETTHGNSTNCSSGFSLIATCSSPESINPSLRMCSRTPLSRIEVPVLSTQDRVDLLKAMIYRHHSSRKKMDLDGSNIARRMEGFLPRDLEKLALRVVRSFESNSLITFQESLFAELAEFVPIAQMSTPKGEVKFNGSWSDIGALFDAKDKLEATVYHPILYRRIYQRAKVKLPRGILLYGPSGCGKSYLVPALARECNYSIVTCKGPEILDKYIGVSEAKVRELFERASQMAPSILFLDELDSLAPRRGSDSTGVTDRVVNQLLTLLDGVEDVSSGTVIVIGATSRPDKIDPAIVRPGRLEQHIFVGPPESTTEWSDLLLKISRSWNLKPDSMYIFADGGEITRIVNDIPRLCPADIRAAFATAHLHAVHRTLAGDTPADSIEKIVIEIDDIKCGFMALRSSLSESEARILDNSYRSFRGNRPYLKAGSKPDIGQLKTSLR